MFWGAITLHIVSGVAAAYVGNWTALVWIVAATLWMINAEFSSGQADRFYRELIEALEESAKIQGFGKKGGSLA